MLALQLRRFTSCSARKMNISCGRTFSNKVTFSFVESKSGNKVVVEGELGKSVLDVAVAYDVDIEGACGGELACSTCHVIVSKKLFDILPPKKEEEDDMLDLAWGLKATSRLCCQLKVTKDLHDAEFIVPEAS